MEGSLPAHRIQCQWALKNRKRREVGNNTTMPLENISRVISIQKYSFLWISNAPKSDKTFLTTLNNFPKTKAEEYYKGLYDKYGEGMSIALALSVAFDPRKKPAIIQMERNNNKITRTTSAIVKPMLRARLRLCCGSLLATNEMKIILSTPKTISRKVSVSKLIQAEGCKKISKL